MITIVLFIIAGIFNAIMDVIKTRWDKSIFSKIVNWKIVNFCNPAISWMRKYKNGDPKQGPAFLGSTTSLVALTDLWHLCKALMLISICAGVVLYKSIFNPWIDAIILLLAFTVIFEIFYSKILMKKVGK